MAKRYVIIPGRAIGPFELGKSRDEIEALGVKPSKEHSDGLGTFYPMVRMSEAELMKDSWPRPGINITYDEANRCRKIAAVFSYKKKKPIFTLFGEVVNGMTLKRAGAILSDLSSDTRYAYAAIRSDAAGIRAGMYEPGDEHIMTIVIMPPEGHE